MARGRQCDANAPGIFVIQIGLAVLILIFSEFYWTRLQVYRQRNLQNKKDEDELTEPTRTPQTTAPMRRRPTDETVIFEKDFPDLRSVIFSP
uniref:Uncharacterized protein n=1 Tax=Caenorhabditis japonica TaxID=281687 RepID=A0A8R1IBA2_CAEJA